MTNRKAPQIADSSSKSLVLYHLYHSMLVTTLFSDCRMQVVGAPLYIDIETVDMGSCSLVLDEKQHPCVLV